MKDVVARRPNHTPYRCSLGARSAPSIGPALGQYRLKLMAFCKDFDTRARKLQPNTPMAVSMIAYRDNTFEFTVKSPSVTSFLKKVAGLSSSIAVCHVHEIAKVKDADPFRQHMPIEAICKSMVRTANSMVIRVVKGP